MRWHSLLLFAALTACTTTAARPAPRERSVPSEAAATSDVTPAPTAIAAPAATLDAGVARRFAAAAPNGAIRLARSTPHHPLARGAPGRQRPRHWHGRGSQRARSDRGGRRSRNDALLHASANATPNRTVLSNRKCGARTRGPGVGGARYGIGASLRVLFIRDDHVSTTGAELNVGEIGSLRHAPTRSHTWRWWYAPRIDDLGRLDLTRDY